MGLLGENKGSVRACEGGLKDWFDQGLYGKMEEVFRGTSPLKKLFKGSHRFLKQLLQRVDPLPVSALSFNNNTIAEETEIKNDFFHYLKFWM